MLSIIQAFCVLLALVGPAGPAAAQDSATIRVRVRSDSGNILPAATVLVRRLGADSSRVVTGAIADTTGTAILRVTLGDSLALFVRSIGSKTAHVRLPTHLPPDTTLDVTLTSSPLQLGRICTTDIKPALRLWVPQAQADSTMLIRVVVRDRAFVERRDLLGWQTRYNIDLAVERPGVYDVEVSSPGYKTWSARRLVVAGTTCGPITRELHARLEAR